MKTLLNIETFGITLTYNEELTKPYIFEYADVAGPAWHEVKYETREEALADIVSYILNPDNVYAMEDQPEDLQEAYRLAGVPTGVTSTRPEITNSVGTFLYYVLDGIICANEH